MRSFSEFIEKPSGLPERNPRESPKGSVLKSRFKIMKSDEDKMLAFGWASVAVRVDGEVIEDYQKDIVEPEVLENAAYQFVEPVPGRRGDA